MLLADNTLGKYKILSTLGSGGFGTVYLAEDTWINKKVALKVPHRQNLNFSELLREPRLLAALDHPNIVSITTAEKQDNVFFIVMEYVPGDTLETVIATGGRLEIDRVLDYTTQITRAVEHAHAQGVIHRDIKPSNIMLDSGHAVVTDFGIALLVQDVSTERLTASGLSWGSPEYMGPEQAIGDQLDARSDVYSLGCVLFEMLTGDPPFTGSIP